MESHHFPDAEDPTWKLLGNILGSRHFGYQDPEFVEGKKTGNAEDSL
jgi:hypothetical protein